nr:MAG TPA: hypothetical protein [Caudoviricetes sp.]
MICKRHIFLLNMSFYKKNKIWKEQRLSISIIYWCVVITILIFVFRKIEEQWIEDNKNLKKESIDKLYSIKSRGEGLEKVLGVVYIPYLITMVNEQGIIVNIVVIISGIFLVVLLHAKIAKCEKIIRKKEN